MVPVIDVDDIKAYVDSKKVDLSIDAPLAEGIQTNLFARLSAIYNVDGWTTGETTPALVQNLVAMTYVAYLYNRTFSEDEDLSAYAVFLLAQVENLMQGLLELTIILPESETGAGSDAADLKTPAFYPTDASSAMSPTDADPSLGGPAFSMGTLW